MKKSMGMAMKRSLVLIGGMMGILFCTELHAAENGDWKTAFFQIMQGIYQSSDGCYSAQLADLDNNGTPELIVYEEFGDGITSGRAEIYYMAGESVYGTGFIDLEESFSTAVCCDTYTGEECFLTDVDCLEWTEPGNVIDDTVRKTERLCFDGKDAWKETVEDFSAYQGSPYSRDIDDAYQQMKARYRFSETSGRQVLYNSVLGGYAPTEEGMITFLDKYRYCGYLHQNTTGDQVSAMISLLGKTREEVNTSQILTNEHTGFDENDVIYYSGSLYGATGSAYIDYAGGTAQAISVEFAIEEKEAKELNVVGKIRQELDETMRPVNTSDNGDGLYTYTWSNDELQVSLTDTVRDGWRMFAVNLYRSKEIARAGGGFESWEDAYRVILNTPEEWLESGNGWLFDLIDLNQDGTPELVCVLIQGARAISADITVFTFRDNTFVEVPIEDHVGFSGIGGFGAYVHKATGETQWLMNFGRFQVDSLVPGSYLESSGGQSGVARLTSDSGCTQVYYSVVFDSERDLGVQAIHAGGIVGKPLWEEGCVTQEAYDKIQVFLAQYTAGVSLPEMYIACDMAPDQAEIASFLDKTKFQTVEQNLDTASQTAAVEEVHSSQGVTASDDMSARKQIVGMWADHNGHRWQFNADGMMGSAGEYAGATYSLDQGQLIWSNGISYRYEMEGQGERLLMFGSDGTLLNTLYKIDEIFSVQNVCDLNPGIDPVGNIDELSAGKGTAFVAGWAFDPDTRDSVKVHVYIGGDASSGTFAGEYTANAIRADIDQVYGVGNDHGVCAVVETTLTGWQDVYVYAINVGSGSNVLIAYGSVNIR